MANCKKCNKELIKLQKSFCSRQCFHEWLNKKNTKLPMLKFECNFCHNEFVCKHERKFCSRSCHISALNKVCKIGNKNCVGRIPTLKGKKYDQFFGVEKSLKIRKLQKIAYLKNSIVVGDKRVTVGLNENYLLDLQEKIDRCKIVRQFPIRNLGYFVDGYCPETNTVYEVYEPAHKYKVSEDFQRENEIRNFLGCNFIIIQDN